MRTMHMTSEPAIEEMLADPIVRLLMAHDGVREGDLRQLIRMVSCRLANGAKLVPARCSFAPGAGFIRQEAF